jgi:hypothetical protein
MSPWGYRTPPNLDRRLGSACVTNIAQISFQRTRVWPLRNIRHLPNICHAPNTGLISFASTHPKRRARPNWGNAQCWWRVSRVLVAQSAGKRCHCGSSSLKNQVSTRRLSNARNAMTPKPWWRRYPLQQRSLFRQDRFVLRATCAAATGYENTKFGDNQAASAFGINGSTAASTAMTA